MGTVEQLPDACLHAGAQMLRATKALIHADAGEAQNVLRVHVDLTVRTVEAEASVIQLLRHEGDPRDLAVSLQTVADVNQMNILARRVARVAMHAQPMRALPDDVNGYFSEMGDRADQLGRRLGEFLEGTTQMHRIRHEEDEMDRQHRRLFNFITGPQWVTARSRCRPRRNASGLLLRAVHRPRGRHCRSNAIAERGQRPRPGKR